VLHLSGGHGHGGSCAEAKVWAPHAPGLSGTLGAQEGRVCVPHVQAGEPHYVRIGLPNRLLP
jgi:hypothetical protein